MELERLILGNHRGLEHLDLSILKGSIQKGARHLLEYGKKVVILSGFYIITAQTYENDGLLGAIALARALQILGIPTLFLSDRDCSRLWENWGNPFGAKSQGMPILDRDKSRKWCQEWLKAEEPSFFLSIERCGPTPKGRYLNMAGKDISSHTAKLDLFFEMAIPNLAIGDGGNEIGMGNIFEQLCDLGLKEPCITPTDILILAGTSNWGGYALIHQMEKETGKKLLWSPQEEASFHELLKQSGIVDGVQGKVSDSVDSIPFEEYQKKWVDFTGK
ncbi:MAG: DUF4392 domain-containing protein [Planctomycetota bacterium]|nr:MAG: DUF4392 domain-containing protein [Planctomycetota bacterium]